jgi:hypothetical protein
VRFSAIKLLAMMVWVLSLAPAHAVLLGKSDGSGNTTAPADDPGWDRVGTVNGSTGVYLGEGFVLSAQHVGAGDLLLGSTTYNLDLAYTPQYLQTQSGPDAYADLVIFRILNAPSASLLPIYGSSSEIGMTGTYIGYGLDRGAEVPDQGWLWGSTATKRWGQNVIDTTFTISEGASFYESLVSDFDRVGGSGTGLPEEAHAATGDSGGALFIKDAGIWKLAGIITAVTENGRSFYDANTLQPGDQPDRLYSVRLSAYDDWILTTIPEPGTYGLLLLGGGILGAHLLHRKRKRMA